MSCSICGNTSANHGMIGGHDYASASWAGIEPYEGRRQFSSLRQFARPNYNPTNPVLTKFRSIPEDMRGTWRDGFLAAAERFRFAGWDDNEAAHAVRVLTRLAALKKVS